LLGWDLLAHHQLTPPVAIERQDFFGFGKNVSVRVEQSRMRERCNAFLTEPEDTPEAAIIAA
jgi:hypothetical protein